MFPFWWVVVTACSVI